jgi:hypothetical protein
MVPYTTIGELCLCQWGDRFEKGIQAKEPFCVRSQAKKNLEAGESHVHIIYPLHAPGERDRGGTPPTPDHTAVNEEGLFNEIRCVQHGIAVQRKVGKTSIFQGDCTNTHPFPGDIPAVSQDKYAPGKSSGNTLSQVILTRRELNQGYGGSSLVARRSYAWEGYRVCGTPAAMHG